MSECPSVSGTNLRLRSTRNPLHVHNPILRLQSAVRLAHLPPDAKDALIDVLSDLRRESAEKAQREWKRNKGMTAAYWKAVSIYCLHIIRALRQGELYAHSGASRIAEGRGSQ